MDFKSILEKGKKLCETKSKKGFWDVCEYCEKRSLLFEYMDIKKEKWNLCENCVNEFVRELE